MDKDFFPLGEKDSVTIKERLNYIIEQCNTDFFDLLIICCNTASSELDSSLKNKCKCPIFDVLSYSLSFINNGFLLCSHRLYNNLKDKYNSLIDCQILINNIENNNIVVSSNNSGNIITGSNNTNSGNSIKNHLKFV